MSAHSKTHRQMEKAYDSSCAFFSGVQRHVAAAQSCLRTPILTGKLKRRTIRRALFSWGNIMLRKLALIVVVFSFPAHAIGPDPHQDWHSADSPHFRINYVASQRAQAERTAKLAEAAYARLTQQLHWNPQGKTEVVLLDAFDISNGYSTPFPFNKTALYLAPPDEGELLDNSNWLDLLITHELTHTVHLDKVSGMPDSFRQVFGRSPLLFPNLFEPLWLIEGIATFNESTPEQGRGRLRGPTFEAWLRIEHERGFLSLAEINANGRALPTSKQYLYGVYFYDFLSRRYGRDAAYLYIHNYSNNFLPHVQSNPVFLTGKSLDVLWQDFLADLGRQVYERAIKIKSKVRADGAPLLAPHFRISSISPTSDGVLAVVNDGVLGTQLLHINPQGSTRQLVDLRSNARIDANANGNVLIAQPDICDNYNLYFDLYLWNERDGIKRLTQCQRYRRAVWLGQQIAALKNEGGVASLDILRMQNGAVQKVRTLYSTADEIDAIDLTASADGSRVALAIKHAGSWQVLEFDPELGTSRVLFDFDAPVQGLRYARDGQSLEFIATRDNVNNLWRYRNGSDEITRLSHTYTSVTLHSGVATDGSVVMGILATDGTELRRMTNIAEHEQLSVVTGSTALHPAPVVPAQNSSLGAENNYLALRSIYPRTWLPLLFADRGLHAYGLSTFGADALGWHNYTLNAMWETSQGEAIGNLSYNYLDRHLFFISRNLWARQWMGSSGNETTTLYDRTTDAQWVSMLPRLHSEQRLYPGIGAAQRSTDRVRINGLTTQPQMERVAAAFIKYDTRETNWYATNFNRGTLTSLLYETYRPFNSQYDGHIVRFDTQGLLPLGRSVLSVRWGEARASGSTEPFQLGGAFETGLTAAPVLNQRNLPLRGYAGSEIPLRGENVRNLSIEWQTPLADIDRHAMSPPIGINRLSAAVFLDAASVWNQGASPSAFYRGVGFELLGEIKLLYRLTLPLRLGIARGLDLGSGDRIYFQVGQAF